MADLVERAESFATTAAAFVETLGWSTPQISEVLDEYREVESGLNDRYKDVRRSSP
ncbi:hypothetical protein AB0K02_09700 [Streptomyces sp. NPDC049597]|uniref:hypothetical protein n=1 Tax=Streptomyces sp. NPDC049597 TaxID=3155276 RepID=UPI0034321E5A